MEEIQSKMWLIKAKVDLQKKENEFENSQEKIWDEEYDEILKSGIIPIVVRFIFEENWQNYISSSWKKYLDTYTLATATKYDLITEISQREYSLTDKGKYILKQYPSENLKSDLNPF